MERIQKADLLQIRETNREQYYVPKVLFEHRLYKRIRVEIKWAYVAMLSVLLKEAAYDGEDAYFDALNPDVIETLKILANKKVDADKIAGYLNELEDYGLIERIGQHVYLKKL
ncbi:MAG: hypothetical protein ACSW8B_03635 [bacterium]